MADTHGDKVDDSKSEHWRQWAIDGMPADKIRLAEATWEAALLSARSAVVASIDTVIVPRELTAENGAKAALIGEFCFTIPYREHELPAVVPWDTIKLIHREVVKRFGTPQSASEARVGLPLLYNIVCLHRQPKDAKWQEDFNELMRLADKLLYEQGYEVSPYTTNEHQIAADSVTHSPADRNAQP